MSGRRLPRPFRTLSPSGWGLLIAAAGFAVCAVVFLKTWIV